MENSFLKQEVDAINEIAIVSRTNCDGEIIYVNENFCKISGYTAEELLGQNHRIVNSGFHSKLFFQQMWLCLKSRKPWRGLLCNKSKAGETYWVDTYILPILNINNEISEFISFRFDVTAEKIAEQQLENEKRKIVHLSRLSALGEMAADIAHEVNNPLSVLQARLNNMESILSDVVIDDVRRRKIKESFEKSIAQIQRISKIVSGIRGFSRTNEKLKMQNALLDKTFEAVGELCSEKLKNNNVEIEFKGNGLQLFCHHIQLEQVLVNLINNSIDAITPLKERWIQVCAEPKGAFVEISVTDSGNGISEEVAKKILQPFFTTKPEGLGTGLGLSISKEIIESHAGTFQIDCASPHTRFVILLPIGDCELIQLIDEDEANLRHIVNFQHQNSNNLIGIRIDVKSTCHLENWLNLVSKRFKDDPLFISLKSAHAEFHKAEAEVNSRMIETNLSSIQKQKQIDEFKIRSDRFLIELKMFIKEKKSSLKISS